jgi:Gas vesicle synthesis protein GvpL/GvpF
MIELYAFACGIHDLPEDCRAARLGHVAAVFGSAAGETREDAIRYGLVVQALVDMCDAVLPVRFGERFTDVTELVDAVTPRLHELEDRLAAVDGCVELAVRIARAAPVADDGTAYMRAGLRAARAASTLHALLQERARAAVVAQSPLLHDACYLVARDDVDDFAHRVAAYGAEHPELNLVCTGPWAPASFAEAAA